VSYLKAPEYQDGHPGYSDPIDEQTFLVNTINSIEQSKYWDSTAIVVTYDDSDGWYDHVAPKIVNGSNDATTDAAICTSAPVTLGTGNDRCGYSQRLPFVVISPYTKSNTVSSNLINTASVVKFIEDNWLHGQRIAGSYDKISGSLDARGGVLDFNGKPHDAPVILNPTSGAVVKSGK
jgi:phospholipase C